MASSTVAPSAQGVSILRFVPANLRKMWAAGAISTDALSLVLQLIARMQREKTLRISLRMREACSTVVRLNGVAYAPPVGAELLRMIGALQQAHCLCGFFSHHDEDELGDANPESHFTSDIGDPYDEDWLLDTPLIFQFKPRMMSFLTDSATQELQNAYEKRQIVDVDTRE